MGGVAGKLANDVVVVVWVDGPVMKGAGDKWDIKNDVWEVDTADSDGDKGDGWEGCDDGGEGLERLEGICVDIDDESSDVLVVGGADIVDGDKLCQRAAISARERGVVDCNARKIGCIVVSLRCSVLDGAV